MVKEDAEDPTASIADENIAAILQSSGARSPGTEFYLYGGDSGHMVPGAAIDKEDNNGPVFRLSVTLPKRAHLRYANYRSVSFEMGRDIHHFPLSGKVIYGDGEYPCIG